MFKIVISVFARFLFAGLSVYEAMLLSGALSRHMQGLQPTVANVFHGSAHHAVAVFVMVALACIRALAFSLWNSSILVRVMNAIVHATEAWMFFIIQSSCVPTASAPCDDVLFNFRAVSAIAVLGAACCLLRLPPPKHVSKVDSNNSAKETKQH